MNDQKVPTKPITDLLEEIRGFESEIFPPRNDDDHYPDDTVELGLCPVELRSFYSYSKHCERELEQLSVERKYSEDADGAINARIGQLHKKSVVANALLWYALREYFGSYDGRSMDLAKGWRVVVFDPPSRSGPFAMLQGFLGPQ